LEETWLSAYDASQLVKAGATLTQAQELLQAGVTPKAAAES
jgi:hypothetical protein